MRRESSALRSSLYWPFRSGVDTGKTDTCTTILSELECASSRLQLTIVFITYRVAQAKDLKKRFPGFENYLDLKADYTNEYFADTGSSEKLTLLQNREAFPDLIIQVDSLLGLRPQGVGEVPPFDVVVFDETASILAHLSAATLKREMCTANLLLKIVQNASRVLAMDDGYAQREHDFF
jgi:hypothetical protein